MPTLSSIFPLLPADTASRMDRNVLEIRGVINPILPHLEFEVTPVLFIRLRDIVVELMNDMIKEVQLGHLGPNDGRGSYYTTLKNVAMSASRCRNLAAEEFVGNEHAWSEELGVLDMVLGDYEMCFRKIASATPTRGGNI